MNFPVKLEKLSCHYREVRLLPRPAKNVCNSKIAAEWKTLFSVKIVTSQSDWQREPCGWNKQGGMARILGWDV